MTNMDNVKKCWFGETEVRKDKVRHLWASIMSPVVTSGRVENMCFWNLHLKDVGFLTEKL